MQLHTTNETSCLIYILLKNIKELFLVFLLTRCLHTTLFFESIFIPLHTHKVKNKKSYNHNLLLWFFCCSGNITWHMINSWDTKRICSGRGITR